MERNNMENSKLGLAVQTNVKKSDLWNSFERTRLLLDELANVTFELSDKLSPVLKRIPGDEPKENLKLSANSPLAEEVDTINLRLGDKLHILKDLLVRIDL